MGRLFPSGWVRETALATGATAAAIALLQPLSQFSPSLYHSLISLFSAFISFSLFVVAWIGRRRTRDLALLLGGAAFLSTATFEAFHALAIIDSGLFENAGQDAATQFWIGGQLILSVSVLVAVALAKRREVTWLVMVAIAVPAGLVLYLILRGLFPRCYHDGLFTAFGMTIEFFIGSAFLITVILLWARRRNFDNRLRWLSILAFGSLAAVHLLYFAWGGPRSAPAAVSDVLQVFAFILLYKAVIETGFTRPVRELHQELERRSSLLDQAARVSGFGGWSWDEGNGQVQISESLQQQLGLPTPELSFDEFASRVNREDFQMLRREVKQALSGCEDFSMEIRLRDPAQSNLQYVLVQGKVEKLPNGHRHAFGSVLNITNSKEIEALREDVERMTRHDIKSPLSSLLLVPELLLERGGLDEEQVRMLETLRYEARRMNEMLNRFLDLHRMELGTYRLDPEPVNIVEIVELLRSATRDSSRGEIEIMFDDGVAGPVTVMGERLLLHSMFSHLLDNALEASPVGEPVRVTIHEESPAWVRIEIENKGEVPEAIRTRFFQKYVSYGKRSGTGLGAYTAKLIVTTHRGNIQMRTGPEGTVITIHLPR